MHIKSKSQRRLLGSTALAVGLLIWASAPVQAGVAPAICVSTVSLGAESITCSDYSYTTISRIADDVTVTLNPAAEVAYGGVATVELYGDRNSVTLNGASTISGRDSLYSVFLYGRDDAVTLNGGSSIYMSSEGAIHSTALRVEGENPAVTLNGGSDITFVGNNSTYVNVAGTGFESSALGTTLTLNESSTINVSGGTGAYGGDSTYIGAIMAGDRQTVVLNTGSSINVTGTGSYGGSSTGLRMSGRPAAIADEASAVTLNGGSSINVSVTSGAYYSFATGIDLNAPRAPRRMAYSGVYTPNFTLNDDSSINVYGDGGPTSDQNVYVGVSSKSLIRSTITLNDTSVINAGRSGGYGSAIGLRLGGSYIDVVMNGASSILAGGNDSNYSTGMLLNGDHFQVTLNDTARVESGSLNRSTGIYVGGSYNSVTLNDASHVSAQYGPAVQIVRSYYGSSVTLNDDATIVSTVGTGVDVYDSTYANVTLNDRASIVATYGNGIVLDAASDSTVTLNGDSRIEASVNYAGILVTGNYSAYASEYRSRRNSIVANAGTTIIGGTGILIESGYYNNVFAAGYIEGTSGVAIDFSGTVNSTLTLGTGATVVGSVEGRVGGLDRLILQGEGTLATSINNFDTLSVDANGIWDLTADLDLDGSFGGLVAVNSGTLAVNADLYAHGGVTIYDGATLGGNGVIHGAVVVREGGTLAPGNSPGTINVVGNVTFDAGSIFAVQFEGTDADRLNVNGNVSVAPGAIIQPEFIGGVDGFSGIIIQATGPIFGTFGVGSGGAVYQTPGEVYITATSSSSMSAATGGGTAAGFSRGYRQTSQGGAFGGTLLQTGPTTLGIAGGFVETSVDTLTGSSKASIDGFNLAAYATYRFGGTVLTAAVTGAYQDQDVSRNVLVSGVISAAKGSPKSWLGGAGFGIAHPIPLEKGFTLTPRANVGWQHMNRDAYSETGGGDAAIAVDEIATDTVRGQVGAELSFMVKDPNAMWSVRPNIHAGLAHEWRGGDGNVNGTFIGTGAFVATGAGFVTPLDSRSQTNMAIGAGIDVTVVHGITGFVSYDGTVGGDAERSGSFRLGARLAF